MSHMKKKKTTRIWNFYSHGGK